MSPPSPCWTYAAGEKRSRQAVRTDAHVYSLTFLSLRCSFVPFALSCVQNVMSAGAAGLLFLASQAQAFISTPLGLTSYSPRLALSFSPRPNRVSTTLFSSTKMQEVRGICPICNEPVLSNQPRETDDDGVYFHSACVDAKMLNEGLVRMSGTD